MSLDEKEKQLQAEIKSIRSDVQNNKQIVVDYLVENVLRVDLSIPDVVRAKFSEKMK